MAGRRHLPRCKSTIHNVQTGDLKSRDTKEQEITTNNNPKMRGKDPAKRNISGAKKLEE